MRILDKASNLFLIIIAHGNYDALVDETLPRNAHRRISDNTLISSFDTKSVSISNDGINRIAITRLRKVGICCSRDIIYTIKDNKIYRSETL